MQASDDDIFYDALGWEWDDPDTDYFDTLDEQLFPVLDEDPPAPSTPPGSSAAALFYSTYTESFRRTLPYGPPVHERVRDILLYMQKEKGLNLELFLEALFWGDSGCTADPKIAHERKNFMHSPALVGVLDRWWSPPTGMASGGSERMRDFVIVRATELLVEELDGAAKTVFRPPPDHLSEESLTSLNFRAFGTSLQTGLTSRLWFVLQSLAMTQRQLIENKFKDTFHVSLRYLSKSSKLTHLTADHLSHHLNACLLSISRLKHYHYVVVNISQSVRTFCACLRCSACTWSYYEPQVGLRGVQEDIGGCKVGDSASHCELPPFWFT